MNTLSNWQLACLHGIMKLCTEADCYYIIRAGAPAHRLNIQGISTEAAQH